MQKSIFLQKVQKSLCITTETCTQIQNFKRNYLENYNDSEFTVKTKNAPFFMNFLNINKKLATFPHWSFNRTCLSRSYYREDIQQIHYAIEQARVV
jgi:hypothetical protein